jgi:mannan polymerase II complex ANP1 subunit
MAKRMQYSVVGLPHYTIWHLYEPSADDLRHMEDMENERLSHEAEEAERAERERKISAEFDTGMKDEWEADRKAVEESQKRGTTPEEKNGAQENHKVTLAPPVEGRAQAHGDGEDVDTSPNEGDSEDDTA